MGKITWGLIIANVVIFELVFALPEGMFNFVFETFSFSGPTMIEAWRWFTSLFLHASPSHLFFNILGLYFFGKALEDEIPKEWFLCIYFVSGLIGNVAFMITSEAAAVGASGCVFGIMGAAMLLNPIRRIRIYLFPIPLGIIAVTFVIFETMVVYFKQFEFSNIAHIAHLGGVITGSFFALFYDTRKAVKGGLALIVCIILLVVLAPIFAIVAGIGNLVLDVLDIIIGFFLLGISNIIKFLLFGG